MRPLTLTLVILLFALFGCKSSDDTSGENVTNSDDPQNQQQNPDEQQQNPDEQQQNPDEQQQNPDEQQQALEAQDQDLDGAIGSVTWATEPNKVLIRWFGRAAAGLPEYDPESLDNLPTILAGSP
ncbi:uncharacterized protein METZ01_LOCUS452719, partial [marine metagenome]